MKTISLIAVFITTLSFGATSAIALSNESKVEDNQPLKGIYSKIKGGISLWSNFDDKLHYAGKKPNNNSWVIGGAIGYQFSPSFRTELSFVALEKIKFEASEIYVNKWARTNYTLHAAQEFKSQSLALNGYYHISDTKFWDGLAYVSPYITVGMGVSKNQHSRYEMKAVTDTSIMTQTNPKENKKRKGFQSFAWNAGAGIAIQVRDNFFLDLGYKFYHFGKVSSTFVFNKKVAEAKTKLATHTLTSALRLYF